jgi:CRP/FNR family cyclic AMP-dependent transcriptional regulator
MPPDLSQPSLPVFSWIGHLKDDDRELLSSYGEFFPGHPGSVIIEEGKMQDGVFVVISGQLEVRAQQDDGSTVILAEVGPGETLGEVSLFDPGPATATVTAVEFSQLWRIADEDLIQFMTDNPGAGNVLLRTLATILAQRLRQIDPKAYGLSSYAVVDSPDLPPATDTGKLTDLREQQELQELQVPQEAITEEPIPTPIRPIPLPSQVAAAEADAAAGINPDRPGLSATPMRKRISTGTQALPYPDDLEPL